MMPIIQSIRALEADMKNAQLTSVRWIVPVIIAASVGLSGISRADTEQYSPAVSCESAKITGGEKNDMGYAWRNMIVSASGNEIKVSFGFKVWNDSKTPITQLFLCIGNKVYLTLYNGVPKADAVEEWRSVKKTFTVDLRTPGITHKMTLVQTQQYSVEDGIKHIETEGLGGRKEFGTLTTK
jgi:hypothetical protein